MNRTLSPLSCFYLDRNPKYAAGWIGENAALLRSQCHALGQTWTQIARELGADLTEHPRSRGAYPDHTLTLAGCWAMETTENLAWFSAYTTWLYVFFKSTTGNEHASREYVAWCLEAIADAPDQVAPGPRTMPPVHGVAPGVVLNEATVVAATRRIYGGLPPVVTPAEDALWRLTALVFSVRDWDLRRMWALLRNPQRALEMMPGHPVVKATISALEAGLTVREIAAHFEITRKVA